MKLIGPEDDFFEDSGLYEEDVWERETWEDEDRPYDPSWDWDPANDHYGDW